MNYKLINENFKENYVYNLLRSRGIESPEDYIEPNESYLQSPADLKNIDIGIALYHRCVNKDNSRILIIQDCDVDGCTSAAIIYLYTQKINPNCKLDFWIHDGKKHGIAEHIDRLIEQGTNYDLVIIPDASTNDGEYIDRLDDIHLPCLVIDHHIQDEEASLNSVVINNQISPKYNNKDLTGSGMTYQFCRYYDMKFHHSFANEFIDLAALGIISDMGSLLSMENRFLIWKGLQSIKNNFLWKIIKKQAYSITGDSYASDEKIKEKINCVAISFYIVPMINALIRVGTMEQKEIMFRAFIDGDQMVPSGKRGAPKDLKVDIGSEAIRLCTNARSAQNRELDNYYNIIEKRLKESNAFDNKILIIELKKEDKLPSTINGLLAMKFAANHKTPTLVVRENNEHILQGSIRGVNNSALSDFKGFLENSKLINWCHGHALAAGCALNSNNVDALINYSNKELANYDFGEDYLQISFLRHANSLDLKQLIKEIAVNASLWGQNNETPQIGVTNIKLTQGNVAFIGTDKTTVRIEYNGVTYLKFKDEELISKINNIFDEDNEGEMEVVGEAYLNEWNGKITSQIFIKGYNIKSINKFDF